MGVSPMGTYWIQYTPIGQEEPTEYFPPVEEMGMMYGMSSNDDSKVESSSAIGMGMGMTRRSGSGSGEERSRSGSTSGGSGTNVTHVSSSFSSSVSSTGPTSTSESSPCASNYEVGEGGEDATTTGGSSSSSVSVVLPDRAKSTSPGGSGGGLFSMGNAKSIDNLIVGSTASTASGSNTHSSGTGSFLIPSAVGDAMRRASWGEAESGGRRVSGM